MLVVNTASKCGFTPQYAGLEKLYKDITAKHPDDFVILGFPCNQVRPLLLSRIPTSRRRCLSRNLTPNNPPLNAWNRNPLHMHTNAYSGVRAL